MNDSALKIGELASDMRAWDAFVENTPEATFFHRAGWKTVLEKGLGHRCHFLYAERDGQIEGVLPLAHVKSRLFANALISTPFCVYGGAVATSDEARDALYAEACTRAKRLNVEYLELRQREPVHSQWPRKDLYYTFRREISADEEENLKAIPRKQRAVVRKAMKMDMATEIDTDIERLYPLFAYSLRNLGTPVFPKKYLRTLLEVFGKDCEVLTITRGGEPLASVMSFYFRNEVLPYYAGAGEAARDFKANDYLYWALMAHAGARGVEIFDFGRSKYETGPYHFKRHWGFEPQPLAYEYFLVSIDELPDLSPNNPKYSLFIKAWQKLPIPVTRMLGPPLSRNLG